MQDMTVDRHSRSFLDLAWFCFYVLEILIGKNVSCLKKRGGKNNPNSLGVYKCPIILIARTIC